MKHKISLVAVALSALVTLVGCSTKMGFNPTENSIYVKKDGSVQSALIYTADESLDGASEDSLKEFIQKELDEYNSMQSEKNAVTIDSVKLDGKTISVIYDYASPFYIASWAEYSQDDSIKLSSIEIDKTAKTVAIDGEAVIYFEGDIENASDGVSVDGKRAVTPDEASIIIYK